MTTKRLLLRPLKISDILGWASLFREAKGRFPTKDDGGIVGTRFESWGSVDAALRNGLRGLPGGSSLAQLLADHLGYRNVQNLSPLTEAQILAWADQWHESTGTWATAKSGTIPGSGGETWSGINEALRQGVRGLPGGSSLARLLAQHRGARNRKQLPPLTEQIILERTDVHFQRRGEWPTAHSGPILDAPGETWLAADMALRKGRRGLPGGSSLAMLLAEHRDVRNHSNLPNFTIDQILEWADAWHLRTGQWPHAESGAIVEAAGETWGAVNQALKCGLRGLPGGSSLTKLLAVERGVRRNTTLPKFKIKTILRWADAHRRRTGAWPTADSGPIIEAPGETWRAVDEALRRGQRGLRGGSSLARLLAKYRQKTNIHDQPPLTQRQILAWAVAHHERFGQWPNVTSGEVVDAPGERWDLIDNALRVGHRGQPGGSSLRKLLAKKLGVRNPLNLPPLTEKQIISWAVVHRERTGKLPQYKSGPVVDAPGETWAGIDSALRYGKRGLVGGSSLAKLLASSAKVQSVV
jgi:hypothetical protein